MHALPKTGVERHWCASCEELHEGLCQEPMGYDIRRLWSDLPSPEIITVSDFESKSGQYEIQLFKAECGFVTEDNDSDGIYDLTEIWMCGECETEYPDAHLAAQCCL